MNNNDRRQVDYLDLKFEFLQGQFFYSDEEQALKNNNDN